MGFFKVGKALEQVDGALTRLDSPEGEDIVAQLSAQFTTDFFPATRGGTGEPVSIHAVRNDLRKYPVLVFHLRSYGIRDAEQCDRFADCKVMAFDESRSGEFVKVMNGADTLTAGQNCCIG